MRFEPDLPVESRQMNAEIVSVGTELLLGQILDTHAPTMARILAECGIGCKHRSTVGDNLDRIVDTLKTALDRSDVVVTIGGLGPTSDDLTRDAIALALDDELELVPEIETKLRHFFESRGYQYVESNSRQAMKPTCAEIIPNPNGTAPGLVCRKNGKVVFALPGPKGEFDPMANDSVRPMLETLGGGETIHSRTLRIIGVGESHVEAQLGTLMNQENPTVAPYAHTGEVHLRLTARATNADEAEKLIDPTEQVIRNILGDAVFGTNQTTLEEATIHLLTSKSQTVSTAESMTGGGIGERLTSVAGSSRAYRGGFVTYTIETKSQMLDLDIGFINEHGPVSKEVCQAMAEAVRQKLGTTFGVSIVGNAGPESDIDGKPVGLVYVGISGPNGTIVDESKFRGIREDIRRRGEQIALRLLREETLKS
jgi:nicotinamide-nucleotide amidase